MKLAQYCELKFKKQTVYFNLRAFLRQVLIFIYS